MRNQDNHIFQGLRQDNHPINQKPEFLWEAHNVRLTSRDGSTMLSITNEKSTKDLLKISDNLMESYIGHAVIGKYLILFTVADKEGIIYRINLEELNEGNKKILYKGKELNFSSDHPIQTISDYETSLIQKVYWTDGINPPRLINIAKPELLGKEESSDYTDVYGKEAPFDFVPTLELKENVTINRKSGSGIFPAGVVQYVLTYYNKYQQESNIVYTSRLLYTTFDDRAGSPEETVNTAFQIKVENLDKKFDKLRIYSIIRTSIDAVPTCKRVVDLDIDTDRDTVSYTDDGTSGDIIDNNYLLYLGGNSIKAECILNKDNTLFLGNIKYDRTSLLKYRDTLEGKFNIECSTRSISISESKDASGFYNWVNQLACDDNTSTFKRDQYYRLGVQFQYKTGEWSEPYFIKDEKQTHRANLSKDNLSLPIFRGSISKDILKGIVEDGFLKMRPLVVFPRTVDMDVLCQGVVNPCVFNAQARLSNAPYSQASWIFRPYDSPITNKHHAVIHTDTDINSRELINSKVWVDKYKESPTGGEVTIEDYIVPNLDIVKNNIYDNTTRTKFNGAFFVDQTMLTLNSPDIEFNDQVQLSINKKNKVRIVGNIKFDKTASSVDILTSSPAASSTAIGEIDSTGISKNEVASGYFYVDSIMDDKDNDGTIEPLKYASTVPWLISMWHRQGSLNNDINRIKGARTAVLKKKVFSNLRYSDNTNYTNSADINIQDIEVFSSNEVNLIKLKDTTLESPSTYYGNVDTLVTSSFPYSLEAGRPDYLLNDSLKLRLKDYDTNDYVELAGVTIKRAPQGIELTSGNAVFMKTTTLIPEVVCKVKGGNSLNSSTVYGTVVKEGNFTNPGSVTLYYRDGEEYKEMFNLDGAIVAGGYLATEVQKTKITTLSKNGYKVVSLGTDLEVYPIDRYAGNSEISDDIKKNGVPNNIDYSSDPVTIDKLHTKLGDYEGTKTLLYTYEPIRMKYKSSPHIIFNTVGKVLDPKNDNLHSDRIPFVEKYLEGYKGALAIAEVTQIVEEDKRFGGTSPSALQDNLWIPAGEAVYIGGNEEDSFEIEWIWGDTWYQRFDCLKTYPFNQEDENQVVEIASFMCETRTNLDGRYDRNRGLLDNTNISPTNFNKINPVYSQKNNFFNYRILDEDFYKTKEFPQQILWTTVKTPGADVDSFTNLTLANSLSLDGTNGAVTSLNSFKDTVVAFQENAISRILFNSRVQIQASDGVPIEIANSQKVEGTVFISDTIGCQDKFSTVTTPLGIYFIDSNTDNMYLCTEQLVDIGYSLGNLYWIRSNHPFSKWVPYNTGDINNGIRLFYDPKYKEVYFTPGRDLNPDRTTLCYSEQLAQFTSTFDYNGSVMFSYDSRMYAIANSNKGPIHIWGLYEGDDYNDIFGITRPFHISFISNKDSLSTKIFDTIEMRSDVYNTDIVDEFIGHISQSGKPFNYIQVSNEYQNTDKVTFNDINLRKKLRVWRALVPREKGSRNRIVNPWAKITLGRDNKDGRTIGNDLTILHSLDVIYTS